jgi:hypothetical protein
MVMLDAILQEAASHPSLANSTILNTDQFDTIRGPSSPVFRARLDAALSGSEDLARAQKLNVEGGLEVVEPVQAGMRGGSWFLRNPAHIGEPYPAGDIHYSSIVEALNAAIEWWQAETWCRGVIVRKYDVNHANGTPSAARP